MKQKKIGKILKRVDGLMKYKNFIVYRYLVLVSVMMLFFNPSVFAARASLMVDKNVVSLDDQFVLILSVEGSKSIDQEPSITGINNFEILNNQSSTQVQYINGQVSSKKEITYILAAKEPGRFVLGPAEVLVSGKKLVSNTISITVHKESDVKIKDRPFYMEAYISNKTPFVGEEVLYNLKIFSKVQVSGASLDIPDFNGFIKEEVEKQKEYQKIIDGVRWSITELNFALFPTKEGDVEIKEAILNANILDENSPRRRGGFGFFSFDQQEVKRVVLRTKSEKIKVLKIPQIHGSGHFSGVIGSLEVETKISSDKVKVGDSITFEIIFRSIGNIKNAVIMDIALPNCKIYQDKASVNQFVEDRVIKGEKVFKLAIVPEKEGVLTIPALEFLYFDTKIKKVQKVTTSPITITVLAGETSETKIVSSLDLKQKQVIVKGEDIISIKSDISKSGFKNLQFFKNDYIVLLFVYLLLPIFSIVLFLYEKRKLFLSSDKSWYNFHYAKKLFDKEFKKLDHFDSNKAIYLLRVYIGHKLKIDGGALTTSQAITLLQERNISKNILELFKTIGDRCDLVIYAGQSLSSEEIKKLKADIVNIVKEIERGIK